MSSLLRALIVLPFCLPLCTHAHMQMSSPYPLRSALDPSVPEQYKDYSMTTPLNPDGSNFACKRYQHNDTNPQAYDVKATYQAGSSYKLTLAGSATHEGGSCQISISYDDGASFKVIQSLIGGCPLDTTLNFTIPSFAPSSNSALLSWTWFNLVGNREMYQNCARVQIQGTSSQRHRRTAYKRQSSMDQLPDMFACNVGNSCQTIENAEVVFPNPGPNVVYGQDGVTPNPGPGFVITGSSSTSTTTSLASTSSTTILASTSMSTGLTSLSTATTLISTSSLATTTISVPFPGSNSTLSQGPTVTGFSDSTTTALTSSSSSFATSQSMTSSSSTAQQSEPVISTITVTVTETPGGSPTTILSTIVTSMPITSTSGASSTSLLARDTTISSSTTLTTITIAAPSSSSTTLPSSCTPGTFACNSPSTFSQCVSSGTYVYMGSVAAGMQCSNGQIVRQNAGSCTPNGQIFCNGSNAFYICDQGGLINMGPVAPGTVCRNGAIVAA